MSDDTNELFDREGLEHYEAGASKVLDALRAEMTRLEQRHCSFAPPDHSRAWRELLLWVAGQTTTHDEGTQ